MASARSLVRLEGMAAGSGAGGSTKSAPSVPMSRVSSQGRCPLLAAGTKVPGHVSGGLQQSQRLPRAQETPRFARQLGDLSRLSAPCCLLPASLQSRTAQASRPSPLRSQLLSTALCPSKPPPAPRSVQPGPPPPFPPELLYLGQAWEDGAPLA